jgi:hypothetical protein
LTVLATDFLTIDSCKTVAISDGTAISEDVDAPYYVSADGFLSAGDTARLPVPVTERLAVWEFPFGTADFNIITTFKVQMVSDTWLSFVFWDGAGKSRFRFVLDCFGKRLCRVWETPMVSGGLHSCTTDDSGLKTSPLKNDTLHTLQFTRTEGMVAVYFDGAVIPGWKSIPLDRPINAVGWRPRRNIVYIKGLGAECSARTLQKLVPGARVRPCTVGG